MATIHIERKHTLGLDAAKEQVTQIASNLEKELQADYQWKGDTLHFSRSGASGTIDVSERSIVLDVKLGMALGLMRGRIERTIHQELDRALGGASTSRVT